LILLHLGTEFKWYFPETDFLLVLGGATTSFFYLRPFQADCGEWLHGPQSCAQSESFYCSSEYLIY